MIDAITIETAHLLGNALPSMFALRHRVFVERQHYEVPTHRGMEWDQFDTPVAVYLIWRDDTGEARAVARLIPTSFPYMIQQLWPDLVATGRIPASPNVWEVTRLGIDRSLDATTRRHVLGEMVCAFAEFGLRYGISDYIFVTPNVVIENALRRAGLVVEELGDCRRLGGLPVIAARCSITEDALAKLRRHHRVEGPVLHVAGDADERKAA